ncbi:MAG: zinc ribbon domain-containing protein [Clostridia bacterium]|nr:zinc ribbon domain-containing protein [Clostridia bacterium]
MKYCMHCGKEICDDAVICVHCGRALKASQTVATDADDAPNTGLAVLGFFVPIAGLILYLINKDKAPLKAKSAGKGALIGVIVSVALGVLYGVLAGVMLAI